MNDLKKKVQAIVTTKQLLQKLKIPFVLKFNSIYIYGYVNNTEVLTGENY
ncbi:hypothetical protein [Chengkuizengella sediminis]|nr:hypothetical protein [Chengkuizengella sediminis]NDI35481.1 hypothetical protein [Chengkuizengella sediminis]